MRHPCCASVFFLPCITSTDFRTSPLAIMLQFEKHGYEMSDAEVEIIEVDWEEVEEEVVVSELQEFEDVVKARRVCL